MSVLEGGDLQISNERDAPRDPLYFEAARDLATLGKGRVMLDAAITPGGAITPINAWHHGADLALAPLRRSATGAITPVISRCHDSDLAMAPYERSLTKTAISRTSAVNLLTDVVTGV